MKQQHFSTEEVIKVLTRVQKMYRTVVDENGEKGYYGLLFWEERDWLVVLQWMQTHGLFKTNKIRPPFAEFVQWIETNHVPQIIAICEVAAMSVAFRTIGGAHYPWNNAQMGENILDRWRELYETMDTLWEKCGVSFTA